MPDFITDVIGHPIVFPLVKSFYRFNLIHDVNLQIASEVKALLMKIIRSIRLKKFFIFSQTCFHGHYNVVRYSDI